jgi:hypothetical protein
MKINVRYYIVLIIIAAFCLSVQYGCSSAKPKSATDKRMKKQEKHRKKHPCPQIDC